ncbi:MAG: hypothetical protein KKF77_14115 [Proteobacteria bacterium]|nr:hypothetical protein [Pseudomonadota bacterium]
MPNTVYVPLPTQLISFAVLMQLVAVMAVLWRGLFGLPQISTRRPRWPLIPLLLGTGAGVWYAYIQLDLVFGVAQGLALFLGYCLITSTRGNQGPDSEDPDLAGLSRRERRAAKRAAKRGDATGE